MPRLSRSQILLQHFRLPTALEVLEIIYGKEGCTDGGLVEVKRGKAKLTAQGRIEAIRLLKGMFNTWISQVRGRKV